MSLPTPAEVVELVFPVFFPEHGDHSLRCICRGTDAKCTVASPPFEYGGYSPYAGMYAQC